MSPHRRNFLVGAVVVLAMVVLGWMIVQFGGSLGQPFAPASTPVTFIADRADGVADGSPVLYRGVIVGKVTGVARNPDNLGVRIAAVIDDKPPLPANVHGVIRNQSLLGAAAAVSLELNGPPSGGGGAGSTVATAAAAPEGRLGPGAEIPTSFLGLDLLPPEFATLATELRLAARQFRESGVVDNLNAQISKLGGLVDSLRGVAGDEKFQQDLRASADNIQRATRDAATVAERFGQLSLKLEKIADDAGGTVADVRVTVQKTRGHIDDLAAEVRGRVEQVAKLLETFQSISAKVDRGDGTAGLLVNDPKLYAALVETSQKLSVTVSDLNRLVEQWEQEGVSFNLK